VAATEYWVNVYHDDLSGRMQYGTYRSPTRGEAVLCAKEAACGPRPLRLAYRVRVKLKNDPRTVWRRYRLSHGIWPHDLNKWPVRVEGHVFEVSCGRVSCDGVIVEGPNGPL
jgi:hypothetical protein